MLKALFILALQASLGGSWCSRFLGARKTLAEALTEATAAEAGAEATRPLRSKFGRAA